jgi:hypothetical protein
MRPADKLTVHSRMYCSAVHVSINLLVILQQVSSEISLYEYRYIMILIVPTTFHTHCVRVSIQIRASIIIFSINYVSKMELYIRKTN